MKIDTIEYSKIADKEIRKLYKKYNNIFDDIESFIAQLQLSENPIGDRLQGLPQFLIYKVRVKNASAKSGKSGGFRVIYYLKKETAIYIISVYSKSEKSNITTQEIIDILGGDGLV